MGGYTVGQKVSAQQNAKIKAPLVEVLVALKRDAEGKLERSLMMFCWFAFLLSRCFCLKL